MTTDFESERLAIRRGERDDVFPVTASRVKLYDTCPRWFAYEYGGAGLIEKLPRVSGPAAELGDRFHRLMKSVREGESIDVAAERFDVPLDLWERWLDLRRKARDFVHVDDPGELAGLEETISWRFGLPDGRQAEVEARLDELWIRPDDTALVRDYKTGSPFGIPAGRKLKKDVQLRTYALAAHKEHPILWRYEMELLLPESGERRKVRFELDDVETWEKALISKTRAMANDVDFKPRPGTQCRICPYALGHCPLGEKLNGPFPPLTSADAAKGLAGFLFYVEGVQKQLKEQVEEWAVTAGPVQVGEGSYAKHTTHALTIPPDRLGDAVRILRQYGIDLEDDEISPLAWFSSRGNRYLYADSFDGTPNEEYIPELAEMAVRRTSSRFYYRQKPRDGSKSKRRRSSDYSGGY